MKNRVLSRDELRALVAEARGECVSVPLQKESASKTELSWSPYMTKYLFHTQNLRGTASLLYFDFRELGGFTQDKAILKGGIVLNNEGPVYGSVVVDLLGGKVQYRYKGKSPCYNLTIDPSKRELWDGLIKELATHKPV